MKKLYMLLVAVLLMVITGCSPSGWGPASSAKAITAFSFATPAATGTITEAAHTIAITVPYGTDRNGLIPTITHTGASISPDTGVAHDFTSAATYTVTAADSSTQDYTVTVTVAALSAKEITAFSFATPAATGTITEATHTIAITVPYGTDRNGLIPTIAISTGTSISPLSGVSNDFTSSVTYTVTAADATTQEYTVTVTIANNDDATLKATSTVKGEVVASLGTPNEALDGVVAGSVTITSAKALDTTNDTTFITLFGPTDAGATVKVVKYATGVNPTATFVTDTAYNNEAITDQDFFIIRVTSQDSSSTLYYKVVVTVLPTYSLADVGPSGGWIFYINANYATDGWRYLEAAPLSTEVTAQWSGDTMTLIGTSRGLGTGQANTTAIVTSLNSIGDSGRAAQICDSLSVVNGSFTYSDWFLPSADELSEMYTNLKVAGVGGFTTATNTFYWSSTENYNTAVYIVDFSDGIEYTGGKNFAAWRFRCARAF